MMRMKKLGRVLAGVMMIVLLACCGNGASDGNDVARRTQGTGNVQSVLEQEIAKADKAAEDKGNGEEAGGTKDSKEGTGTESSEAQDAGTGDTGSQGAGAETVQGTDTSPQPAGTIDVDLTKLSSTMVYSEVYNMMYNAPDYVGKVVKMRGLYSLYYDEGTGKYYHACIIQDATACCAQGIEFELTEDYRFPEDYPEVNDEVCVTGTFDIYYEGQYQYVTLRGATLQ
ncbi:MAG: hypothetical protein K6F31_11995 [Acetatifactor sp.]|nr:hypothetical protein [Acetatifactor sp.]